MSADLQTTIDAAWEQRDTLDSQTHGPVRAAVEQAIAMLDSGAGGALRVGAERVALFPGGFDG